MPFIQLQLQLTVSSTKLPTERSIHVCSVILPPQAPRAMMRRRRRCTAFFLSRRSPYPGDSKQEPGRGGQDRSVDRGRAGQVQLTADLNLGLGQILFSFFYSFSYHLQLEGRTSQLHLVPDSPVGLIFLLHVGDWIGLRSRPAKKDQIRWGNQNQRRLPN